MLPLTSREIPDFSILKAVNSGLLPRHYPSSNPGKLLDSYIGDYLREEIASEAPVRNVPAFSRFLDVAAISNGEIINYSNIASECGVTSPTAKEYFQILEDTLLGRFLPAFRMRRKRRVIRAPKFYFFDIGVVSRLTRRGKVDIESELFGRVFEHFIYMEVYAHSVYSEQHYPISYWRTTSGFEVDLVLGDNEVAIEIKSSKMARDRHLKGLRAFREEQSAKHHIMISNDPEPRKTSDGIVILPWRIFLDRLWNNELTG